jgi:radical SAM enzyme (TIGR01210 family)
VTAAYPELARERDTWVVAYRVPRIPVDSNRPYAFLCEEERSHTGDIVNVATIFLTNRECPWRCVMCDLWKNTLEETVPLGAIPKQIDYALARLPAARQIKLYNSGSFFDRGAIPIEDQATIAKQIESFDRVIIECHPALVDERVLRFRDLLQGRLEIAMGLETAHPETLARLNKRMTIEDFSRAAEFLRKQRIALRVFVLVKPPFQDDVEAREWCRRSVQLAFDCGATAVSLISTRSGNGALEALSQQGRFTEPTLDLFEEAVEEAIGLRRGRVFGDLWDLERFSRCSSCFPKRLARLQRMNLQQRVEARVHCEVCGSREAD